jgi:hypothetical protein
MRRIKMVIVTIRSQDKQPKPKPIDVRIATDASGATIIMYRKKK